jgi:hypothetical protein
LRLTHGQLDHPILWLGPRWVRSSGGLGGVQAVGQGRSALADLPHAGSAPVEAGRPPGRFIGPGSLQLRLVEPRLLQVRAGEHRLLQACVAEIRSL